MPPEDELSDEVPLREDEYEATPEVSSPSDSAVDFAPEGDVAAAEPYDEYAGPVEDLSEELAEDAGDQASYGYDSASETARYDVSGLDPSLLAESNNAPDESDKYRLSQSDPAVQEPTSFAEEAATAPSDEAIYEPTAAEDDDTYASHNPDEPDLQPYEQDPQVDEMSPVEEAASYAVEEAASYTAEEEAPVAAFTVEEEEPAPAPRPAAARKPAPAPEPSHEARPGQVRKSAIDEMFQRAADLKRRKGS